MKTAFTDYAVLFLLALIWGSSFGMIKVGVEHISPLTLVAGRVAIAALILYAWLRLVRRDKLELSAFSLWHYLVVGLLGHSIPFSLITWSETFIDSSVAAVLMGVMPIVTAVLAHFFLKDEPFDRLKLLGIAFGFGGLVTLLGTTALKGLGSHTVAQLVTVVAAISYASVTIYVRRYVQQSGLQIATGAMIVATITSTLIALTFESPLQLEWTVASIAPIFYLGVFPTAVASLLYFQLVRKIGATSFSQVNYIIPLVGSLIGVVFMGESPKLRMWLALCLILIGIALVRRAQNSINLV